MCDHCHQNKAVFHLTQVVGGQITKLHLCESCAKEMGVNLDAPISIANCLLGGGLSGSSAKESERSCPRCHMRRTDFKKTGRFGCASCYEAFAEDLPPLLKAMHRADHHTGKVPARESRRVRASAELARLQQEMDKAIAAENFEEAARLRDEILACRRRLNESDASGTP